MSARRIVAIVVVLALAAGSLAGAFLLSNSDPAEDPVTALRGAAAATRSAPSVRTTTHLDGDLVTVEDFVAPHRLHQTGPPLVQGASGMDVVVIGRDAYVKTRCTKLDPPVTRWRHSTSSAAATGARNLRVATMLIDWATKVRRVAHHKGRDSYRFTPVLTTDDTSGVVYQSAEAVVAAGRLESVSFVATYPQTTTGGTRRSSGQIVFTRYGTVPPITAPPASETISADAACDDIAIHAGPAPSA